MNPLDTEQLFQEIYNEKDILPEKLGGKVRIVSCLSARRGEHCWWSVAVDR